MNPFLKILFGSSLLLFLINFNTFEPCMTTVWRDECNMCCFHAYKNHVNKTEETYATSRCIIDLCWKKPLKLAPFSVENTRECEGKKWMECVYCCAENTKTYPETTNCSITVCEFSKF